MSASTEAPVYLHLDFETFSKLDLKKVGAYRYAKDPSTGIMCFAWRFSDWPQTAALGTWADAPGNAGPALSLVDHVRRGGLVKGWNVQFERLVWNNVLRRIFPELPVMTVEQTVDTMAAAAYWGLPLSLDQASQALPELGIKKDMEGRRLMLQMTRPRKVHKDGTCDWWHKDDPEKLDRLIRYCCEDVKTEAAVDGAIPPLPDQEREIWLMDQRVNDRGVPLDVKLCGAMREAAETEMARLDKRLALLTNNRVEKTSQVAKLTDYLEAQGVPRVRDRGLAKDVLPALIEETDDPVAVEVLQVRQEAAKSSIAKLDCMLRWADPEDHRIRGMFQHYGAFRTGRWAGRGPQPQNYPRPNPEIEKLQAELVDYIKDGGLVEGIMAFFGVTPLDGLSSSLRGCFWIVEGDGYFGSLDFAQIEARVLAWLAGEAKVLQAFRDKKDLYVVAASGIYGVPEHQVDKSQRQVGKVSVLALGYQGGIGAFQAMGKVYGLQVPDAQADQIKVAWRGDNKNIVSLWYACQDAAIAAVENPGRVYFAGVRSNIKFRVWKGHLCVQLPSDRVLVYRDVELRDGAYGPQVTYMGVNQYTRQWERVETYGGKLVENITQAVARDLMAEAMVRLENGDEGSRARIGVLGSVHDEVLLHLPTREALGVAETVMGFVPAWAEGLPLGADGYAGRRFKKD